MYQLVIVTFLLIESLTLKPWFSCQGFKSNFYPSPYSLQLQLEGDIHNDTLLPLTIVRFVHNKVIYTALDVFKHYLLFWDTTLLVSLVSFVGFIGLPLGFWFLLANRKRIAAFITIVMLLTLPLLEEIFQPKLFFPFKIFLFMLPYQLLSLYGIIHLLQSQKGLRMYGVLTLLLYLSLLWCFIQFSEVKNFCISM